MPPRATFPCSPSRLPPCRTTSRESCRQASTSTSRSPYRSSASSRPSSDTSESRERTVAKILIVDDVPANVRLLADVLAFHGYEISTATCGAEALEQVKRDKPDLMLLDVMMPDMSGYEVCAAIRAEPAL